MEHTFCCLIAQQEKAILLNLQSLGSHLNSMQRAQVFLLAERVDFTVTAFLKAFCHRAIPRCQ